MSMIVRGIVVLILSSGLGVMAGVGLGCVLCTTKKKFGMALYALSIGANLFLLWRGVLLLPTGGY